MIERCQQKKIRSHQKYEWSMEYYSVIMKNKTGSFVEIWLDLRSVIQNEVSQKEKNKYRVLTYIHGIRKMVQMNLFARQQQRQM